MKSAAKRARKKSRACLAVKANPRSNWRPVSYKLGAIDLNRCGGLLNPPHLRFYLAEREKEPAAEVVQDLRPAGGDRGGAAKKSLPPGENVKTRTRRGEIAVSKQEK